MDQEQAERFLEAAQHDYAQRVSYYADLSAPGALPAEPEEIREARADVLAAQQVLEVARTQMEQVRRKGQDSARSCIAQGGICEGCAGLATVLFLYGERYLCPTCGVQEETGRRG